MAHVLNFVKYCTAALSGLAGFLWGELDGLLLALIAFMAIDYITGVVVGWFRQSLSSGTGFKGIAKKGLILCVVAVGHIMDTQLLGGGSSVCRSAVIGFYLANEGLSILENAGNLGLPLPQKLRNALEQLKSKDNDEGGQDHERTV